MARGLIRVGSIRDKPSNVARQIVIVERLIDVASCRADQTLHLVKVAPLVFDSDNVELNVGMFVEHLH
jgi:hypothetical protein